MDRNSIIGFILIGVLIVVYTVINQPTEQELARIQRQRDSIAQLEQERASSTQQIAQQNTVDSIDDTAVINENKAEEQLFVIENELLKIQISNLGGRIVSVQLKKFENNKGEPVILWKGEKDHFALLQAKGQNVISTQNNVFRVATAQKDKLVLKTEQGGGIISYTYALSPDSYETLFDINLQNINPEGVPQEFSFLWTEDIIAQEKGRSFEDRYSALYYKEKDADVEDLSARSDEEKLPEEQITWVAFKSQFFSSVLITNPENSFSGVKLKAKNYSEKSPFLKRLSAQMPLKYEGENTAHFPLKFYFGPNDYSVLRKYGKDIDLHKLVYLGWGPIGWVNRFLVVELFNLLEKYVTNNYGIIILFLTIIIKLLLAPLTYKSYVSSAKMRVLKPQIEEINNKIPKDKAMERQQATMALYRKVGVNPLGGCVPVLVQMPILFAMFNFFPVAIQLRHKPFLWADDLSSYDSIASLPFNIPFYGDHVSLFCLLMAATTLIYNHINMQNQPTTSQPGMPNMKFMMYLMPIFFLGFFNQYASGLSYYYFIATLFTIVQTIIIRKFLIDDKKLLAQLEENKAKPSKPKSKFRQRLEEMQKQQAQMQKQNKRK